MIIKALTARPETLLVVRYRKDGVEDVLHGDALEGVELEDLSSLIDVAFTRGGNQTMQVVFEPNWPVA